MWLAELSKVFPGRGIMLGVALLVVVGCGAEDENGVEDSPSSSAPSSATEPTPAPDPEPEPPPASVAPPSTGELSVTLSWSPPAVRVDGSSLDELQGYRIRYGYDTGDFPYVEHVTDASVTSYELGGLEPGVYHFVIHSVDADGMESPESDEIMVVLGD